jgi:hypothetical protein
MNFPCAGCFWVDVLESIIAAPPRVSAYQRETPDPSSASLRKLLLACR